MNRNLHVIAPADEYTPGGVTTEIPLSCLSDAGKVLPVKVTTVIIRIITTDPLTFEILTELGDFVFGLNEDDSIVLPGSKIYNQCTEESIYVLEYKNDIIPFISCCSAVEQGPIDEAPATEDPGPGNIPGILNQIAMYVVNAEESETAININIVLNANQTITINWGDGFTAVLSGNSNYNISHVFTEAGVYGVAVNFTDDTKLIKFKVQNGNISGLSGLDGFVNLTEFEISNSRLVALPDLPTGLLKLNFNSNNIEDAGVLPALLTELKAANNLLTDIAAPNSVETLVVAGNIGLDAFDLPTSLELLDCSGCGVTALAALPSGLIDLNCSGNSLTDVPDLPANILNLDASDNEIAVADIGDILDDIVANAVDNGTLSLQDQTPAAIPDVDGQTAITTLQGRGWIVEVDA